MDNILYDKGLAECKDLDELFELWKKEHKNEQNYENTTLMDKTEKYDSIEKNSFNKDGYIDENKYKESNVKVLFILKETNIWAHRGEEKGILPENREQIEWYLDYINEGKTNRPKQHEKMGRMAFYLQNKNSNHIKSNPIAEEYKKALKSCAFMNMNKRGGKEKTTEKYYKYVKRYEKYIIKQIEILNPDYVVILGSNDNEIINKIETEFKNKCIIRMWHTAYCMRNRKRYDKPEYSEDKNVDCYMREFFKRVENYDTK